MKRSIVTKLIAACIFTCIFSIITLGNGDRSKTFSVKKGGTLTAKISGGDIKVNTWNKSEVYVNVKGVSDDDAKELEMSQSGNDVNLNFQNYHSSSNVIFEITVPDQYNVKPTTSGGDIIISGPISGNVNGQTSGGDLTISNVTGELSMTTSGGDIKANELNGNVNLKTSGGDIELSDLSGDIKATTSGGDIKVKNVKKTLKLSTSGGDITLTNIDGELKASTSGGDIKVDQTNGPVVLSTSGGDIHLNGANGKISAMTSGGDLKLTKIHGSIVGKTSGGDVITELYPSGNGKNELVSSGGKIELSIPSDAKVNIEATIKISGIWSKSFEKYKIISDFKADTYVKDDNSEEIQGKYTINGGGEKIMLKTVNSDIYIKSISK